MIECYLVTWWVNFAWQDCAPNNASVYDCEPWYKANQSRGSTVESCIWKKRQQNLCGLCKCIDQLITTTCTDQNANLFRLTIIQESIKCLA